MSDAPPYDVFISYCSRDGDWVREVLLTRIESAGLRAFVDFRDFRRGAPSISEMERGVTTSRKTLLVLTPAYIESEWCEIESIMLQTLSPANRDLRLIPLLKARCEKPLRLGALTHIDFTDVTNKDLAWSQLLASLKEQLEVPRSRPVPPEIQASLDKAKELMDADKHAEAIPILEDALALAVRDDHAGAQVRTRTRLAHAIYDLKEDIKAAENHYREALAIVPAGDLELKHTVLQGLGHMLLLSGRLSEAKGAMASALDAAEATAASADIAASLVALALLDRALGLADDASGKLSRAREQLMKAAISLTGDKHRKNAGALAACYLNQAILARDAGRIEEALTLCKQAESQHELSGDRLDAGRALLLYGELRCLEADWQDGFDCFRRAMGLFLELKNSLWMARATERISRLHASHDHWDEAVEAMLAAASGAAEAGHFGEQVHFLCLAAKLLRNWKTKNGRESALRQMYAHAKGLPEAERQEVYSAWSAQADEVHQAIDAAVRADTEALALLKAAEEIAIREQLNGHLANCLLDRAHHVVAPEEDEPRKVLLQEAMTLLKTELAAAEAPKRRGQLICQISGISFELGNNLDAMSWLQKAAQTFESTGDVGSLSEVTASIAELYRRDGRLDDEIGAYDRALSLVRGRSFPQIAAGARIGLADALRYRGEYARAEALLAEAERLCDRHKFKALITAIAHTRGKIERELQAGQAPSQTLPQLLASLDHLIQYNQKTAVPYLAFWYFAWKSELLALVQSGMSLSFMVVTDDVSRFLLFAANYKGLADLFLMATSAEPNIQVESSVLAIPPNWLFPLDFPLMFMKRKTGETIDVKREFFEIMNADAAVN